jgi:[ribosomal protein S5]-alanine N-acetyltransferase
MTTGWPAVLSHGPLRLRPLTVGDRRAWRRVRQRNVAWLSRWDATTPPGADARPRTFRAMVRAMHGEARAGRQLPFALEYDGEFIGQLTVNNVTRGSAQFASVGYWIDERYAGRGLVTRAVAMAVDHCFFVLHLHRIEIAIRPENAASLRIVEKLGIPEYGFAPRYLHIDGDWRDHRLFSITREDCPRGLEERLARD